MHKKNKKWIRVNELRKGVRVVIDGRNGCAAKTRWYDTIEEAFAAIQCPANHMARLTINGYPSILNAWVY
jgi:hypothetical protein